MSVGVDQRIRHLEMIQGVVGRLSQNSFVVRSWSVTVVSAVFAVVEVGSGTLSTRVLIAIMPAIMFWGLDAYYLRQERLFRCLYAAVAQNLQERKEADAVPPFGMDTNPFRPQVSGWWRTALRPTVAAIPLALIVVTVMFWLAGP
jgi:hypothetical protein